MKYSPVHDWFAPADKDYPQVCSNNIPYTTIFNTSISARDFLVLFITVVWLKKTNMVTKEDSISSAYSDYFLLQTFITKSNLFLKIIPC